MWAYMLRALKDPSKSHGPIQVPSRDPDGRDRQMGHERCPEAPAWGRAPEHHCTRATSNQAQPYTAEHCVVCTGVLVSARAPLLRGRTYVRMYPTLVSRKSTYKIQKYYMHMRLALCRGIFQYNNVSQEWKTDLALTLSCDWNFVTRLIHEFGIESFLCKPRS